MSLIPVFRNATREELMEKWNLEFPLSEWVAIELPFEKVKNLDKDLDLDLFEEHENVEYETNRYDVQLFDAVTNKNISVFLYMDENLSTIIAIDEVCQDKDDDIGYPTKETPFWDIITSLAG